MHTYDQSFAVKWHPVYFFVPVFETPIKMPTLDAFLEAMQKKFGQVEAMADNPKMPTQPEQILGIALWSHLAYYEKENQSMPSQLILFGPDTFEQRQWDEMMIAQFWDCPDREGFAKRCQYALMASNLMAANLPGTEQYQIIADYADLILDLFSDCIGIYWPHSQRLVPREVFQATHGAFGDLHFLDGGLNVRFFNIEHSDEMLFDTLGLTAIGLPDLQCHCKDLEPGDVVAFLRNLAAYLYEKGDIIEDGNTVEGIDQSKWVCQREDAMIPPERMVLDICPGKYAGGDR